MGNSSVTLLVTRHGRYILMELVLIPATSHINIGVNMTVISVTMSVQAPPFSTTMAPACLPVFILSSTIPSMARNTVKSLVTETKTSIFILIRHVASIVARHLSLVWNTSGSSVIGLVLTLLCPIIMKVIIVVIPLVPLPLLKSNQEKITSVIIPVRQMKSFILMELALIFATFPISSGRNTAEISATILVQEPPRFISMDRAYLLVFTLS